MIKKITKAKAIAKYCLECSGDSPKEVTLCHLIDCPLWSHRMGSGINSKQYKRRMDKAKQRYATEIKEMLQLDPRIAEFFAP